MTLLCGDISCREVGTEEKDDEDGAKQKYFYFLSLYLIRTYLNVFGSCKKSCCFWLSGVNAFLNAPFLYI